MEVGKNKVVTIDYKLTDQSGDVLDSSEGGEPLSYIHGTGSIVPGLEDALEGKTDGESVSVTVEPEEAYGDRNDELLFAVDKSRFEDPEKLDVGVQFQATYEGDQRIFTVAQVEEERVVVDGNHPLAGMTLNFDVEVKEVREASEEEIAHGHAHDQDGGHGRDGDHDDGGEHD